MDEVGKTTVLRCYVDVSIFIVNVEVKGHNPDKSCACVRVCVRACVRETFERSDWPAAHLYIRYNGGGSNNGRRGSASRVGPLGRGGPKRK